MSYSKITNSYAANRREGVTKAGRCKASCPRCGKGSPPTSIFIETPSLGELPTKSKEVVTCL